MAGSILCMVHRCEYYLRSPHLSITGVQVHLSSIQLESCWPRVIDSAIKLIKFKGEARVCNYLECTLLLLYSVYSSVERVALIANGPGWPFHRWCSTMQPSAATQFELHFHWSSLPAIWCFLSVNLNVSIQEAPTAIIVQPAYLYKKGLCGCHWALFIIGFSWNELGCAIFTTVVIVIRKSGGRPRGNLVCSCIAIVVGLQIMTIRRWLLVLILVLLHSRSIRVITVICVNVVHLHCFDEYLPVLIRTHIFVKVIRVLCRLVSIRFVLESVDTNPAEFCKSIARHSVAVIGHFGLVWWTGRKGNKEWKNGFVLGQVLKEWGEGGDLE